MVKSTKVKPVTETKKSKITKFDAKGAPFKVAVPPGFNFAKHSTLKKGDFDDEAVYCEHRAAQARFKADSWDVKAKECRELGSPSDRRKKKQVVKLQSKMNELKKQLAAQGIDVDALLKNAEENK